MKLEQIVPWGRSHEEYTRMFALDAHDLQRSILGCGDGPASFNAELTAAGGSVVSADPIYAFGATALRGQIEAVSGTIMAQVVQNRQRYNWDLIPSPEALLDCRMQAMALFLSDYPQGRQSLRYLPAALPDLPFRPSTFQLVLCSHLLFSYSAHLDEEFHYRAIRAMLNVGREVRIYPLIALDGHPSPHLAPVCRRLQDDGYATHRIGVHYEFQRGAGEMLRIQPSP